MCPPIQQYALIASSQVSRLLHTIVHGLCQLYLGMTNHIMCSECFALVVALPYPHMPHMPDSHGLLDVSRFMRVVLQMLERYWVQMMQHRAN